MLSTLKEGLCHAQGDVELHASGVDGIIPTRPGVIVMTGAFNGASVGTMTRLLVSCLCAGSA